VLELVEGFTLADRITGSAVPLEEALAIARQIAEAMAYAREKGDIERNTSTRLTYDQVRATFPVWSADGSSVGLDSIHGGEVNLYLKLASGAGDERLLLKSTAGDKYATSWSRDGRFLLYTAENPETKSNLWVLPLQGDRKPTPFLGTELNESSGQFFPDGHWIAYTSDESGSDEIYVREFPTALLKDLGMPRASG